MPSVTAANIFAYLIGMWQISLAWRHHSFSSKTWNKILDLCSHHLDIEVLNIFTKGENDILSLRHLFLKLWSEL